MESAGRMQSQLRQNNDEILDYLKGLESWEEEMREKDQTLSKNRSILKQNLPPVRSSAATNSTRKPRKKKQKKRSDPVKPASRIHSYDYKAWDNFDVEKACDEVDYEVESYSGSEEERGEEEEGRGEEEEEEEGEGGGSAGVSSEEEEMERQRAMAVAEKEKGNALYKEGKYEAAIECYSKGIMLDPLSPALPANRALALLKLERYAAVEGDCNTALALEEDYVKAFLRRGVARRHLGKLTQAIDDFERVLKLEPKNKQAVSELQIVKQLKEEEERKRLIAEGHVFPVKRPAHQRSKRPLKRIGISEIAGTLATAPPFTQPANTGDQTQQFMDQSTTPNDTAGCPESSSSTSGAMDTSISSRDAASKTYTCTTWTQSNTSTNTQTTATDSNASANAQTNTSTSSERNIFTSVETKESTSRQITSAPPRASETDRDRVTIGPPATDRVTIGPPATPADEKGPHSTVGDGASSLQSAEGGGEAGGGGELPPLPESTFQFQSDWKRLRNNWPLLVSYFKQLPPARYPDLLQQSLETNIFSDIISILRATPGCVEELTWLTRIQRFSVAVMFLSKTDKNNLQGLFTDLVDNCRTESQRDSLKRLSSKFGTNIKL